MPWLNDDVVEITSNYILDGEPMSNIWKYELQQDSDATEILTQFDNVIGAAIRSIQSSSLSWVNLTMRNLTDGASEAELTYNPQPAGARSGEFMPTFTAYAFKLVRSTNLTGQGQKRIGGCAESDVQGNLPAAPIIPSLNTLAGLIGSPISLPSVTGDMVPVIYRPAIGLEPVKVNVVQSALFTRISTQNSRKKYS